jgi:transposase
MGAVLELEARQPKPENLNELKELYVAREALVKDRTAARNREKQLTLPLLRRQNAQRLAQIERQIEAIEAGIKARLKADPALARKLEILTSVPGLSTITAFALLIEMPGLGSLDGKQAASLAGLAPMTRQSGRWTGRAFMSGGRASVRRALYMPALAAARFNQDLKAKYQQLIDAGKPPKLAIAAIMRKLLVLANALLKGDRYWTEKPA